MFAHLVVAALVALSAVHAKAESPAPQNVQESGLLGCVWEDDAVDCLREQSARALRATKEEQQAVHTEDSGVLEALRAGAARLEEKFAAEELAEPEEQVQGQDDSQGRAVEEGRKKVKLGKFGKKGKKGGGMLQTLFMLKTMFGMLISLKVGIMSFVLQIKTFLLSVVIVVISLIQFFWKLQEKKAHGGGSYGAPAWEPPSTGYSYGPPQSGGWDKRSSDDAHRQAYGSAPTS